MERYLIFRSLLICILTGSARTSYDCQSLYKVTRVCDTSYGLKVKTYIGIKSMTECATLCTYTDICRSVIFNSRLEKCRMNSEYLDNPISICTEKVLYAALEFFSGSCFSPRDQQTTMPTSVVPPGSIFSFCRSDTDCAGISDSECRNQKCQCVPGLSYNPTTNTCIPDCVAYGTTFQEDLNHHLNIDCKKEYANMNTSVECMDTCITETTFICRTADFYKPSGICYLHEDTIASQPMAHTANSDYDHYQRDCAPPSDNISDVIFGACTNNVDCEEIFNAECRESICHCVPLLRYDPSSVKCVAECAYYGTTFQEYKSHFISVSHDKKISIENIIDPLQCMDLCITETDFVCRDVALDYVNAYCLLYSDATFDPYSQYLIGSTEFDHFIRDCAATEPATSLKPPTEPESTTILTTLPGTEPKLTSVPSVSLPGTISSYCSRNADCKDISDAECRDERCQCLPGLSHEPGLNSCLPDCGAYGTTFQEDRGHFLNAQIDREIAGVVDPVHCMDLCIEETEFTCRTATLYLYGTCFLSTETLSSAPTFYTTDSNYIIYQRDCASP